MSLARKYFLNNFSFKTTSICCYLLNDNKLNRAQYYTCLSNSANVQSNVFKHKILFDQNRNTSLFQHVKDKNYYLMLKAKKISEMIQTLVPNKRLKYKRLGYLWYQTLDEINIQDFFEFFSMVDSFYSRFKVIELHVWMLLYHLPTVHRVHELVRYGLIEAMWDDCEQRARLIASFNAEFNKNFKEMYGKFLLTELLYDDGFAKGDAALCSAVWCCFFNREDINPRLIETLVSYIRYQMQHLNKYNMEELTEKEEKGQIWAPVLPHLQQVLNS